ncbi:unnamed protein product [Fusarium graminearum]|uniref:Chromosome 1, complete genome n=1 Tax=Gibberella zeae (strain ATCC MYA-4620 / CBS 123657 / FGSC 9075 / NRRL 31084 / PH-1) TaxID=229533 RepID=I1S9Z5_GIBZE|nr:hypothetical protein FGSG_13676 [Fusarium graminearum PH-1]ESU16627.1 hypothetical protein FGSG_13676 [Fusarium graminearum PH-1]CEF75290.1 unnamed protein product [Fusarium graminearum]CZS78570.1 unnamed protein product [Fusarium graminearum]|eukprot:XP_011318889.1 hypothetical protein FGSG_13676 [Fusarium graminearum PH-1]
MPVTCYYTQPIFGKPDYSTKRFNQDGSKCKSNTQQVSPGVPWTRFGLYTHGYDDANTLPALRLDKFQPTDLPHNQPHISTRWSGGRSGQRVASRLVLNQTHSR